MLKRSSPGSPGSLAPGSFTPRLPASRWRRARGVATIEFVLVFPILLVLSLLMLQFMLLMVGRMYVQYAAFAAARSAIVQTPRDLSFVTGEQINEIFPDMTDDDSKIGHIKAAAAWAVMPVAGQSSTTQAVATSELTDALTASFQAMGAAEPAWIDRLVALKTNYAFAHTEVQMLKFDAAEDQFYIPDEDGLIAYDPQDSIGVNVTHRFSLTVPLVRKLFQDGETEDGPYAEIKALAAMTNEGVYMLLPETPSVSRTPQ